MIAIKMTMMMTMMMMMTTMMTIMMMTMIMTIMIKMMISLKRRMRVTICQFLEWCARPSIRYPNLEEKINNCVSLIKLMFLIGRNCFRFTEVHIDWTLN